MPGCPVQQTGMIISLLGGESSGKSSLAAELTVVARASLSHPVSLVPEYLREWCERKGRAPLQHEQAEIADEQGLRIRSALERPDADGANSSLVIADTTPAIVAAYSELYFQDNSLWDAALAFQRECDLTLLMGLDIPWVPDGLFRDNPSIRLATDDLLRRRLNDAGIAFQTVYGKGPDRLRNALRLISPTLQQHYPDIESMVQTSAELTEGRGSWNCEACSDPDCEHRLFTRLMAGRAKGNA